MEALNSILMTDNGSNISEEYKRNALANIDVIDKIIDVIATVHGYFG